MIDLQQIIHRKAPLGLLVLLVLLGVTATDSQAQATGAFSRMGFDARGIAMGNALVADAFGDASAYYNPALAPFTPQQHLDASAAFLSLDRELQFLQYATPLQPVAGIAAGFIHAGVSNIEGRDFSGYRTQTYSTDEISAFLAFGIRAGGRLSLGAALQVFRTDLVEGLDPVTTLGLDLGITLRLTEQLRFGLTADDLLARYSYDSSSLYGDQGKTTSDKFPRRLRGGLAYQLMDGRALVSAEVESRTTLREFRPSGLEVTEGSIRQRAPEEVRLQDTFARIGAEVRVVEPLALRIGVDGLGAERITPSAGFMVEQLVGQLRVRGEYAFSSEAFGVGTMHLLTLRVYL